MGDGMMGCAGGMGFGLLLGLLLLVAVGYVAYRFGQSQSQLRSNGTGPGGVRSDRSEEADEAVDVARRRYAQGEISREEFEQLRRDLA